MATVAALKKKAADFEQKKQLDKAIAAYLEILDVYDTGQDENIDVSLYNRVADLLVRQGNTPDAVTLYERAVDLYTEGGFFNNAIALCNKVLRTAPGRSSVYYKLGKISAAKGFNSDAKENFLEYADRMERTGQLDEAFRALAEFADLCPDEDDIRLMLAEQLTKAGRKTEALEQLQLLYARYESEGRFSEAQATVRRMKAIDPNAEVKAVSATTKAKSDDLIFIDLSAPTPRPTRRNRAVSKRVETPQPPEAPDLGKREPPRHDLAPTASAKPVLEEPPAGPKLIGLEPTSLGPADLAEPSPLAAGAFAGIDLRSIPEARKPKTPTSERDLALPGDLPSLGAPDVPFIDLEPTTLGADVGYADVQVSSIVDLPLIDTGAPVTPVSQPAVGVEELAAAAPVSPSGFDAVPIERLETPPPVRRGHSRLAASSVAMFKTRVEEEPENWTLRRQYAEALLEEGERDAGLGEMEAVLVGLEKSQDLDGARSVADEIIRLNPSSVRHHQKRVEYAFRSNDRPRLAEAYLALADSLFRDGQSDKAKAVYGRVLEIAPGDARAKAALEAFGPQAAPPPPARPGPPSSVRTTLPPKTRRYTAQMDPAQQPPVEAEGVGPGRDDDFVSLGDWLREDERPKSTRLVVEEEEPTGDEQADFADMLRKFKKGIAENVDEADSDAHYDLGVAYKEMGLVDEAIAEFQKALRGPEHRVRSFEALGQCFLEKKQLAVASTILERSLSEPGVRDDELVGVLYLLGYINQALNRHVEAKTYLERVFAVDIHFRDVGDRLNAVDRALK